MALLLMDGFDIGDTAVKWPQSAQGGSSSTTTRFGTGRSFLLNNFVYQLYKVVTTSTTLYMGAAVRISAADTNVFMGLGADWQTSPFTHHNLRITGNTTLALYTGNTLLTTYTHTSAFPGGWFYFELGGTLATSGGTAIVRIDGATVINFTGNTKSGGTSTSFDHVTLKGDNSGGKYVDDVYVCDGTGSSPYNTFLGEVRVHSITPSAAGSSTQWTPDTGSNYARVNEIPYSASNYIQSSTVGQRDTYTMTDLPANTGTVLAVQNNIMAKKTDATVVGVKTALKSGASVYYGSTYNLSSNDTVYSDLRTTDPNTATAWTSAGVNALEAGIEVA